MHRLSHDLLQLGLAGCERGNSHLDSGSLGRGAVGTQGAQGEVATTLYGHTFVHHARAVASLPPPKTTCIV